MNVVPATGWVISANQQLALNSLSSTPETHFRQFNQGSLMEITVLSQKKGVCRIKLSGEVTQRQLRKFVDPLEAGGDQIYSQKTLCDMSGTTLLDSAGVSWILVNHKRCREAGGQFVVHSIPRLVMNVILVLRLNLVFDIADDDSAALILANQTVEEPTRGEVFHQCESADKVPATDEENEAE